MGQHSRRTQRKSSRLLGVQIVLESTSCLADSKSHGTLLAVVVGIIGEHLSLTGDDLFVRQQPTLLERCSMI